MDFIKKHFEKILLATTLVVLLGVALVLWRKVDTLSEQVAAGLSGPTGKTNLALTRTAEYSNTIAAIQAPANWKTSPLDPFHTGIEIYTPPPTNTNGPVKPILPVKPFVLKTITRKPFRMIFKSYTGLGENFAVSEGKRTFFISKVGDKIWSSIDKYDTGFVVSKFEKKESLIDVPGIGKHLRDTSELTIQRGTEPPILLVLNRITEEREPEAVIICQLDNLDLPVRKGQHVVCGGKLYNVVDITLKQVLIVDDETREKLTISKD